jgi:large conductance mechanosensitive channel
MIKEFKEFIMRGNVLDMAIGVIIGAAFKSIVDSLTTNLINPIIAMFVGSIDLSGIYFTINNAKFKVGAFLNDVINFFIIAIIVFLIVKGFNKLRDLGAKPGEESDDEITPVQTPEEAVLVEIRDLLQKQNETK